MGQGFWSSETFWSSVAFWSSGGVCSSVTLVVRGPDLGASMSDYLIQEIDEAPNVTVRLGTEVVDGLGGRRRGGLRRRGKAAGAIPAVRGGARVVM